MERSTHSPSKRRPGVTRRDGKVRRSDPDQVAPTASSPHQEAAPQPAEAAPQPGEVAPQPAETARKASPDAKHAAEAKGVDVETFAKNLARLVEEGGKALAAYLKPREEGRIKDERAEEITDVVKTLGHVMEYWFVDPQRAFDVQSRLGKSYLELWAAAVKRMAGEKPAPVARPDARDKRFSDPEWSSNQFFDFLKQAYLLTVDWANHLVEDASGLDPRTRQKAEFYMHQIANAVAPSNFVLTNPELLRETLSSSAGNLVRGMHMLAEDIEAGGGDLVIRQSDPSKFKVGRNLATTSGKVIHQNELMQLIQYAPSTKSVLKAPLLIVPPWINKFYVLDLTPEQSFIKWCVDQGLTVFCVSWVNPDARLAEKSFAEYMREGPLEALDIIEKVTGENEIHALGYCVGGTLLAITLAHMAAHGDARVRSATLLTTQVDFTHAGDLKVFAGDEEQIEVVERQMAALGYLEAKKMTAAFNLLRANDLIWPYIISNYLKGQAPFPFDLLVWNADATRLPAANHSFYLRNCYLGNRLTKGEMEVAGEKLDLKRIKIPIYNVATREDHIAPAKSVYYGSSFFGGPVKFVLAGSGHIAGVINPPAKGKYQHWTGEPPHGDDVERWIATASERPGSWWPDWIAWLKQHDPTEVDARVPGGGKLAPIEDAPGSYVKVRS